MLKTPETLNMSRMNRKVDLKYLTVLASSLGGQPLSYRQEWQRLLTGYREMPKYPSPLRLQRQPNRREEPQFQRRIIP